MALPTAWSLTTFNGGRFTRRTAAMLRWVQKRAGVGTLQVSQAGWNAGGVSASGGTHDKDAVDLRIRHLTSRQKAVLVKTMRDAGFAAWIRPAVSGLWGEHLHAVPIAPSKAASSVSKYLSPQAAWQVVSYLGGRDGLKGNRIDSNKYRPGVRWSYVLNRPVKL